MIDPVPPRAPARLPRVGAGLGLLREPTRFFQRRRQALGDTFLVDAFGYRLLCVFSPEGVRNLWALPEKEASKGVADYFLLRHKVPDELFAGRRTRPHDLFARDDVAVYLDHVREAVDIELRGLGVAGRLELFAFTRRLGHRVGLASWGGVSAESAHQLDRLVPALDRLDIAESFVRPHRGLWTMATGKRAERRALARLDDVYREILSARGPARAGSTDLFDRIRAAWDDVASPDHFEGRRFVRADELPARELVTTFGHGRHSCPAQGFSIAAIGHATRELLGRFELTPRFRDPRPLRRQLGGVARADRRCRVD